ncbi:hypothetical protein ACFONH_00415 [Streptomonospora nanhaiensis]|uniref:hypothetical protein n=1 Tax=Streptomonospora nanhaiensis TaxID=1323731 RepID=UPI00360F3278
MPSDDEHGARQENTESWFRPSGDRHRSQAQYQETFSDSAESGDPGRGAPGGPAPEASRQEPGAPGEPARPRPTFPNSGGYPGLSGERPGMAEPYPSALGDLGGSPLAPPGPPAGDPPSPIRPYAAPAPQADRPAPAEAAYDLGTTGPAAPGEAGPRPGTPAPGPAAGADPGRDLGDPAGGYARPAGGGRPGGEPGSPLSALGGGTGGYPGFGSTVRGRPDQAPQAPAGPAESLWPGQDGAGAPGRPAEQRPAADDGPDTAPFAGTGRPAPGDTDPRPWGGPAAPGEAGPRPWGTPAADTERPSFGDRPVPGAPAERFGAGEGPAFGERTDPGAPAREWSAPAGPAAGDPLSTDPLSGGRAADSAAPWDTTRPGAAPAASDPAGAPGERPSYGADPLGGSTSAGPADDAWRRPTDTDRGGERDHRADTPGYADPLGGPAGAPGERPSYGADPLGGREGSDTPADRWGEPRPDRYGAPSGAAEPGRHDDPAPRSATDSGAGAPWGGGDPLAPESRQERRESADPLGADPGRAAEWGTGQWETGARPAADLGAPAGGAERGDGYDDELSRPYSSRIPADDDLGATSPGYRQSSAPAGTPAANGPPAGDTGADRRADDPARADTGLGGDLGTGSGNTWAFSRDDERLPEHIRQAAAEAQRKRRDGSPEHTTQVFRSGGDTPGTPGGRPDTGPRPGTPVTDLGDDPLAAIAAQQARARSDDPEPPASAADPGWGGDPGPGTQAVPAVADELGPDLRESRRGERPGEDPGAPRWSEREPRPADEGGPSTQAMPAVADELGPDLRDEPRRDPLGGDRGAPWAAEDPAARRDPGGYGAEPGGGYDRESADRAGDPFGAAPEPYGSAAGDPAAAAPGDRTQAFPPGGFTGAPGTDHGRGEPADPWRREPEAPSPYLDGGAEYPRGHREGGEFGGAPQGYADTPYGDRREAPEPGGAPYGTRHQEPYAGEYGDRHHGRHGEYGEAEGHPDTRDDRGGRGADAPTRRGRSGRDPVADDFPGFDDRPPGAAAGDAYPGYDNIDYWPETAPGAAATLWLGIIGLVPVIGLFTAIAALVTGPRARRAIQRSNGELEGLNLVRGGTITAWVGIALFVVEAVVFVATTVLS